MLIIFGDIFSTFILLSTFKQKTDIIIYFGKRLSYSNGQPEVYQGRTTFFVIIIKIFEEETDSIIDDLNQIKTV